MSEGVTPLKNASDFICTPLAGALGAEVVGIDVSDPLDSAIVAALKAAFLEHKVLAIRDQSLAGLATRIFTSLGRCAFLSLYNRAPGSAGSVRDCHGTGCEARFRQSLALGSDVRSDTGERDSFIRKGTAAG